MKVLAVFTSLLQRGRVVACAILALGASPAQAAFPGGPADDPQLSSMGVFKIIVAPKFRSIMTAYPGFFADGRLYTPVVVDLNTVIGRSSVHTNGNIATAGEPVGGLGTLTKYADFAAVPADFASPTPTTREVFTEIRRLVLMTNGRNGCTNATPGVPPYVDPRLPALPAGTPLFVAGPDGGASPPALPRSIGQVQSKIPNDPAPFNNDFPARGFFDVFAEVTLISGSPYGSAFPGAVLRLSQPLVLTNQLLTSFPPVVIYTPSATTAPALVFKTSGSANGGATTWAAGEVFGWLVLAGHSTGLDCGNPAVVQQLVNAALGPPTNEKPGLPLPPGAVSPIPTLSQWGLIIFGLLLLACGTAFLMRLRVPGPSAA